MNPIDSPQTEAAATSHNATLTINAPGAGRKIYICDLTVKSDTAYTITIQSGGVTTFLVNCGAGEGYEKAWRRGLPSINQNEAVTIAVSAGAYDINVVSVTA